MVVNSHYINRKKVKKRKKEKLQSLLLSPNMSINKYVSRIRSYLKMHLFFRLGCTQLAHVPQATAVQFLHSLSLQTSWRFLYWNAFVYVPVLRIHNILALLRIREPCLWLMDLYWYQDHAIFFIDLQDDNQKIIFQNSYYFLKIHIHQFLKAKVSTRTHKTVGIKAFLTILHDKRRIRINTSDKRIRIREAQKHKDRTDTDPTQISTLPTNIVK
jgi:hypothetical protein